SGRCPDRGTRQGAWHAGSHARRARPRRAERRRERDRLSSSTNPERASERILLRPRPAWRARWTRPCGSRNVGAVTPRARLLSFGGAGLLVVLGGVAGPVLGGITGEAVAIALISLGAIAIVSLVFL